MPLRLLLLPFEGTDAAVLKNLALDLARSGIESELLPPAEIPTEAYARRRNQYRAEALLGRVREQPGLHVLGVTDRDLYADNLNFVFGLAEMPGRAAVISLCRLHSQDGSTFRLRALKEAVHELGHTLGLPHCPDPGCVMHFSNTLADTDSKGTSYCRICRDRLRHTGA